jgi:hypothetical protein
MVIAFWLFISLARERVIWTQTLVRELIEALEAFEQRKKEGHREQKP